MSMDQELEGLTSIYSMGLPLYRAAGWPSVLPIPPAAKTPPPDGYTGGSVKVPDDAEYLDWVEKHPTWNVALRMPEGVLGVDIDDYGPKTGLMNIEEWAIDRELPRLPPTWWSSSREGGSGIYFFRVPAGRRYVSAVCQDVEVIRHGHRYAVVWPSVHPRSSATGSTFAQYRWHDRTSQVVSTVPRIDDLALMPVEWVQALTVAEGGMAGGGGDGGGSVGWLGRDVCEEWIIERDAAFRGGDWSTLWNRIIERLTERASQGTRHDAVVSATASIVGAIAQGMMPGSALWRLAEEAQALYTTQVPPGKYPKDWEGDNEVEFWTAVGGALAKHLEPGHPWWERIQPASEVEQTVEWLLENPLRIEAPQAPQTPQAPEMTPAPAPPPQAPEASQEPQIQANEAVTAEAESLVQVTREIDQEVRAVELALRAVEIDRWLESRERTVEVIHQAALLRGVTFDEVRLDPHQPIDMPRPIPEQRWLEIKVEAQQVVADRRSVYIDWVAEILPHWVEDDWLPKDALTTLVSPPSVGKTLWSVDLSCRLAMGIEWFGHRVEQCPVLYLAYESPQSVKNRVAAWSQFYDREMAEANQRQATEGGENLIGPTGLPRALWLVPMTGSLRTEGGRSTVRMHAETMAASVGIPGLIVVDTLAAGFGEGEENSATDMQAFLTSCARLMADLPGLSFQFLHHPTKENYSKPTEFHSGRGSGALKGAVAVEWACRRIENDGMDTGMVEIARLKARDGDQGKHVAEKAKRHVHQLLDADGLPLKRPSGASATSVVLDKPTAEELMAVAAHALTINATNDIEDLRRITMAVESLLAEDAKVTRRAVEGWLKEHTGSSVRSSKIMPLVREALAEIEAREAAEEAEESPPETDGDIP